MAHRNLVLFISIGMSFFFGCKTGNRNELKSVDNDTEKRGELDGKVFCRTVSDGLGYFDPPNTGTKEQCVSFQNGKKVSGDFVENYRLEGANIVCDNNFSPVGIWTYHGDKITFKTTTGSVNNVWHLKSQNRSSTRGDSSPIFTINGKYEYTNSTDKTHYKYIFDQGSLMATVLKDRKLVFLDKNGNFMEPKLIDVTASDFGSNNSTSYISFDHWKCEAALSLIGKKLSTMNSLTDVDECLITLLIMDDSNLFTLEIYLL